MQESLKSTVCYSTKARTSNMLNSTSEVYVYLLINFKTYWYFKLGMIIMYVSVELAMTKGLYIVLC